MIAPQTGSQRFAAIDGLRGFAALLVVWTHQCDHFAYTQILTQNVVSFWDFLPVELGLGRTGVMIFFCISGFVICQSLQNGVRAFWINRVFRLYPLFWCSIPPALYFFSVNFAGGSWLQQLLGNLSMVPGAFGVPLLMEIYWTLEIEMAFYLLAAVLVSKGWLTKPNHYLAVIGSLVTVWFLMELALPKTLPLPASATDLLKRLPDNLAIMFWGGLYRLYFDAAKQASTERSAIRNLLLIGLGVMCLPRIVTVVIYFSRDSLLHLPNFVVCFVMSIALFAMVARYGIFKSAAMVYTGRLSYGMYLFHYIAICIVALWVAAPWFPKSDFASSGLARLAYTMVLTFIIAHVLHWLVEQPAIGMGHRLAAPYRIAKLR